MDNFEAIKQIWTAEKAENLPSIEEMQTIISTAQKKIRVKILWSVAVVVICLIVLILAIAFANAELVTTVIGEVLMFSAICVLLTSRINSLRRNWQCEDLSNSEFINKLKMDIERLTNNWNGIQKIGFWLIGGGYSLFLYESVRHNQTALFVSYGLTAVLLFVAWKFLRPFANSRKLKNKKLLLEKIENLEKEIKE